MIICHVITGLWDGGAEAALFRLCTARPTPTQKHVVISLMGGGVYARRLKEAGIEVHTLDMPRGALTTRGIVKCYRLLRVQKPDLVQTWMYHADLVGGLVASTPGRPPIVWGIRHANLDPGMHSRATLRVVRVCALLSRWLPARIVTCSQAAVAVHRSAGYDDKKFVVIANGYPMGDFVADPELRRATREALGIPQNVSVMGMAARFHPLKDHASLFNALRIVVARGTEFVCLLTGSGMSSDNETLVRLIASAGLTNHVRLLGPSSDVGAFMNAIDLHVLSSISEGFPNVLAEAMACQTPCVTTDAGDARAIVGKDGWVVTPGNAGELAKAIEDALHTAVTKPEDWQDLRARCRRRIEENFPLERMVAQYNAVWSDVLASHRATRA